MSCADDQGLTSCSGVEAGREGGGEGLAAAAPAPPAPDLGNARQAGLQVGALACPRCGGEMKVVAFVEPPQGEVIERILRHCGMWHPRPPPAEVNSVHTGDGAAMGNRVFYQAAPNRRITTTNNPQSQS